MLVLKNIYMDMGARMSQQAQQDPMCKKERKKDLPCE